MLLNLKSRLWLITVHNSLPMLSLETIFYTSFFGERSIGMELILLASLQSKSRDRIDNRSIVLKNTDIAYRMLDSPIVSFGWFNLYLFLQLFLSGFLTTFSWELFDQLYDIFLTQVSHATWSIYYKEVRRLMLYLTSSL
jgi:hypothetical protein